MNQGRLRVLLLMLCDSACFLVILLGTALFFRDVVRIDLDNFSLYTHLWPSAFVLIAFNTLLHLYHGNILYPGAAVDPVEELRNTFYAVSLTFAVIFFYLFLRRQAVEYSRWVLMSSWILTVFFLPLCRIVLRKGMRLLDIGQIPIVIAGASPTALRIARELKKDSHFGFKVIGFLDDRPRKLPNDLNLSILGPLKAGNDIAREYNVKYVICSLPLDIIREVINDLGRSFRHITIIPDYHVLPISWAYPVNLLNSYASVEICNQLLLKLPRFWKIVSEALISFFVIVLSSPLLLILGILVKLTSRGPVFYYAKRMGIDGKQFRVIKFRTMYVNADKRLHDLLDSNPELKKEWEEKFKLEHDPRVTPFGRFLRKSSLDELPQMINVLRGEMSLIGPRPIVPKEMHYYAENLDLLRRVKPGVTGLWQVSGRSNLDYETRVRLDVNYIVNWSIWLDYYILLRTVIEVVTGRGAK